MVGTSCRFIGGGNAGFLAFINAGVHTVMYLYYFLAGMEMENSQFITFEES
jgi:hypothetical protein